MKRYAFKKPLWTALAQLGDKLGYSFRRPPTRGRIAPAKILVVRLDQLGDIIQTLPFFCALRQAFPQAQIHFLTVPIGVELLKSQGLVDHFHIWNCRWFDRSRNQKESALVWMKKLQSLSFDAAFELRGDIRLIAMLNLARVKNLIGYGATGGGFLLDVEAPWDPQMPAIDKNLRLLEAVGVPVLDNVPRFEGHPQMRHQLRPALAVHPDAGTEAKRWPADRFAKVINKLQLRLQVSVILVGLNERLGAEIASRVQGPIENRMGKTDLQGLIDCLGECEGLLSNDSGPAHLMAALGKPVWVVWSGTADKKVWAPRGERVTIFEHPVPCAPCSLARCVVPGHPCLTEISADEIVSAIAAHFDSAARWIP